MGRIFRITAKLISLLLAIAFIITFLIAMTLSNAENKILNAETYINALAQDDIYQQLPSFLASQIVANLSSRDSAEPNGEETPVFLKYLTVQDWKILLELILPPESMRTITEAAITDFFNVMSGQAQKAVINLRPIKEQLNEQGVEAFLQILRAQPACTPEQAIELEQTFTLGGDLNILCRPSEEQMFAMRPQIEASLDVEIASLEDEILIIDATESDAVNSFQELRRLMRLSLMIPLILMTLITLLAVRTLKNWLRWWGLPLAISGGLMVIFGFTGSPIIAVLIRQLPTATNDQSALTASLILGVFQSISQSIFQPLLVWGLIIGLIGVGAFLATQFLPQELLNSE